MLKKVIETLEKIIHPLSKYGHFLAIGILVFMMFMTFANVTGRYFYRPIYGTFELTGMGLALLIFFSLGYTQLKKEHISVSFIVDKFPPRVQAIVDVIWNTIFFALVCLLSWQLYQYALRLLRGNDKTVDLGIPMYIFSIAASIGILLFALVLLIDLLKSISKVVEKGES